MHGVIVEVRIDPSGEEQARRVLDEAVVPMAKGLAGFRSGTWLRALQGDAGRGVLLFDSEEAARAAAEAGELLFGGDPFGASAAALETVAAEVPSSRLAGGELGDPVELLVTTELASSKSDARRLLQQGSVRANGLVVRPDQGLDPTSLLHGRFLLLRKGKRSYHLAEILGAEVDAPGGGR